MKTKVLEQLSLTPSSGVFPVLYRNVKMLKKENDENFEQLQQHALSQFQQILNTNEKHTVCYILMRKSTHLLKMTTVRKNEKDLRKEEAKEEAKRYSVTEFQ